MRDGRDAVSMIRRVAGGVRRRLRPPRALIEVDVDVALVRRLLEQQFPHWASLPLRQGATIGTTNALFRLGDELVVRVPRREWGLGATDRESDWLPRFASDLPVRVPEVVGHGTPTDECPLPWLVMRWLPGESPVPWNLTEPDLFALDLARFLTALEAVETDGAPTSWRGNLPLAFYDTDVRRSMEQLDDDVAEAATGIWDAALEIDAPSEPRVWVHGDLWPGNMMVTHGRLTGVLDWSSSGVGDQTRDLMLAWLALPAEPRARFREAMSVDETTWARARALAMSQAIIDIPHYDSVDPRIAHYGRYTLDQVLADVAAGR
jgi:aminoglycoside phosphotransferase (APT) family kinase protein